jgi:hypothetical protein
MERFAGSATSAYPTNEVVRTKAAVSPVVL